MCVYVHQTAIVANRCNGTPTRSPAPKCLKIIDANDERPRKANSYYILNVVRNEYCHEVRINVMVYYLAYIHWQMLAPRHEIIAALFVSTCYCRSQKNIYRLSYSSDMWPLRDIIIFYNGTGIFWFMVSEPKKPQLGGNDFACGLELLLSDGNFYCGDEC